MDNYVDTLEVMLIGYEVSEEEKLSIIDSLGVINDLCAKAGGSLTSKEIIACVVSDELFKDK